MPSKILERLLDSDVPVTLSHIQNGLRNRVEECPVALALRAATGERFLVFGTEAVPVVDFGSVRQKRLRFGECVSAWISDFDQGLSVPPMVLRIETEVASGRIVGRQMPLIIKGDALR